MFTSKLPKPDAGLHLRVCSVPFSPIMLVKKDANGTVIHHGGVNVELFDYLVRAFHWTYSFVDVGKDAFNKYGPHGSCFHLLNSDKVDISAMPSPLKLEFYEVMDVISSPLSVSDFRLIVPWPKEQKTNHLLAIIQPFQPIVWLCLLTVPILIIVTIKMLAMIHRHRLIDPNTSFNCTYTLARSVSILLNRGNWNPLRKTSLRLIIGAWCLATLVLLNAYGSVLTSFLSVMKLEPIVNTLEELADVRQPLKLMMIRNTPMEQRFLDATEGVFKKLGDSLRENPENCVNQYSQIFQKMISKPSYTTIVADPQSYPIVYSTYKSAGMNKCQLTLSKILPQLAASYHYYTSKNGPFTELINKKWEHLWDSGLLKYWIDSYKPHIDQCLLDLNRAQKAKVKSMSLKQFDGAFTIFGLGLSLSILVFAFERFWFACRRFLNSVNH